MTISRSLCLSLFVAISAPAATYYVDPTTGNNANAGTATGTAWAQLPGTVGGSGSGWVVLQDGDTVYVKGGSINNVQVLFDSVHYNPAASLNSVQIRSGDVVSWGSGRPLFDQQSTRLYGLAVGIRGIRLNRLEVDNTAAGANAIWGLGSAGIEVGATSAQPSFHHIDDCYIHHTLRSADDQGHGIECYGPDPAHEASNGVIEHNVIGDGTAGNIGTKGIEIYGTNNTIRANLIIGTQDHGLVNSGNHNDIVGNVIYMLPLYVHQPVFGMKMNFGYNDIWNNLVFSYLITTNASFNSLEGIGMLDSASFNRVLFNTVINCYDLAGNRNAGMSLGDENAAGTNNLYAMDIAAFSGGTGGSFANAQVYIGDLTTNCTVEWTDLYRTSGSANVIADHVGATYHYYNTADADAAGTTNGNNFNNLQQQDPGFTGGSLPNGLDSSFRPSTSYFALLATSPSAIRITGRNTYVGTSTNGASSASNKFSTDIFGVARNNWSMGAYEYVSPPAPSLSLSGATLQTSGAMQMPQQ